VVTPFYRVLLLLWGFALVGDVFLAARTHTSLSVYDAGCTLIFTSLLAVALLLRSRRIEDANQQALATYDANHRAWENAQGAEVSLGGTGAGTMRCAACHSTFPREAGQP
jgi:hypothetical protein